MSLILVVSADAASAATLRTAFSANIASGVESLGSLLSLFDGDAFLVGTLRLQAGVLAAASQDELAIFGSTLDAILDAAGVGKAIGGLLGLDPALLDDSTLEDIAGWLYWTSPSYQASLVGRIGDGDTWDLAGACHVDE